MVASNTKMDVDLVIRNGTIVTAADIWPSSDIAIKVISCPNCVIQLTDQELTKSQGGKVIAVGIDLPVKAGVDELQADGAYVTPGGVDSHVHLSQFYEASVAGIQETVVTNGDLDCLKDMPGDTYESGTRSAIAGGTTTVITFASQFKGDKSLIPVIEEYHKLANGQSYCDYAFHVIVSNPTKDICKNDFKIMVEKYGITSVKIYMTYKALKLNDYEVLEVMHAARSLGITTMVHAENADVIDWMTEHLEEQGMTQPHHHGTSRPTAVEAEATVRPYVRILRVRSADMNVVSCNYTR